MWNLTPEKVSLVLESGKVSSPLPKDNNVLFIVLRSQFDDELFNRLHPQRIN